MSKPGQEAARGAALRGGLPGSAGGSPLPL